MIKHEMWRKQLVTWIVFNEYYVILAHMSKSLNIGNIKEICQNTHTHTHTHTIRDYVWTAPLITWYVNTPMELFFSKLCTYPHQMSLLTTWTLASGWLRTPRHLEYLIAVSLMMYDISWEVRWKVFIFETCSVGRENLKMAKSILQILVQRNYLHGL